jgi:hypothetical protein
MADPYPGSHTHCASGEVRKMYRCPFAYLINLYAMKTCRWEGGYTDLRFLDLGTGWR